MSNARRRRQKPMEPATLTGWMLIRETDFFLLPDTWRRVLIQGAKPHLKERT